MSVVLYTHPDMFGHRPGGGHPERPERLEAVLDALEGVPGLDRREAPLISREDLERVHTHGYVEAIFNLRAPDEGVIELDADTLMSTGALTAARRAAGAASAAVRSIAVGEISRAFCAVRPPGHHAEPGKAMGFCFFANLAVAARVAQSLGMGRVAIVDFDVHHGNGTQAAAAGDSSLFFASIHQWPCYPGTGAPTERGVGNIFNAIVPPGAPPAAWRKAFETLMEPLDAFAPDLVLISAGFDAHMRDPLANLCLEAEDFAWATRAIVAAARRTAAGRIVSSLEGGYDLQALGQSVLAHVQALREP